MAIKIDQITDTTLIIGVDIAKKIHWAQITNPRGISLCKPIKVGNDINSFENFVTQINDLKRSYNFDKVIVGFEPSGHYWRTLAWYLKTTSDIILVGVNPYHVKQSKELDDNTQTKSDKKDALVIARLIRDGRYFDIYIPNDEYAELRVLRSYRERASLSRKRILNSIISLLDEYFPEYADIGFSIETVSTRIILRTTPFPSDFIDKSAECIWNIWQAYGDRRNFRIPHKLSLQLKEAAHKSIGVSYGLKSAKLCLNSLLDQLDILDFQIEIFDTQMDDIMEQLNISQYLTSVPGIGKVTAASFISETGDLDRFNDWKQIRKLAGLNLVEHSSGQHKGKTKISKRGRPGLRRVIYIIGDKGMLVSPEMMSFYQYLRHREHNQLSHHQAVLAVGLKLMRIAFSVVKNREFYDAKKSLGDVRTLQIHQMTA